MESFVRELDEILHGAAWTAPVMLQRADYRRRLAHLTFDDSPDQALIYLDDAIAFLTAARENGADPQSSDDTDLLLTRASFLEGLGRIDDAKTTGRLVLERTERDPRPDRRRQTAAVHLMLLRLENDPEAAIRHLERAMEDEFVLLTAPGTLNKIVQVVARSSHRASHALTVIHRMAPARMSRSRQNPASFFGRTFPFAKEYVTASAALAGMAAAKPTPETTAVLDNLVRANAAVLINLDRRSETIGMGRALRREASAVLAEIPTLLQVASLVGVPVDAIQSLVRAADVLEAKLGGTGE